MQFLVNIKRTSAAYSILKEIFPRKGIRETAFHYSIIMEGFAREGDLHSVFTVLDRMKEHKIQPTLTTQIVLIKATASAEYQRWNLGDKRPQLASAEKILGEALLDTGADELATDEPIKGIKGQLRPEVYPAAFSDFLIFLYGREGYSEKALDLYNRCLSIASKEMKGYSKITHTIKLIAALMVTHLQGGRYDEVAKYWDLAVKIAWEQARPWNPTDSSAPKQLPSPRKYLLTTPFRYYAKSLCEQGKVDKLIKEVERLNRDGFELECCSMNIYVQLLAINNHIIMAFELCETYLMGDWPSWKFRSRQMKPNSEAPPTLSRARPIRAYYLTISRLSSAISKTARWVRMGSQDAMGTLAAIPKMYPKTMDAIRTFRREGKPMRARVV
jgi:pentatricopeptide repeat-containing protein PET309